MEKLIVAERAQPAGKLKNRRRAGLITPVKTCIDRVRGCNTPSHSENELLSV